MEKINKTHYQINEEIIRKQQSKSNTRKQNIPQRRVPSKNTINIAQNARANSVKKAEMDYKPSKKAFSLKIIAGAMAVILTIGGTLSLKKLFDESITADKIDSAIVQMIAPESERGDAIAYSTYRIGANEYAYNVNLLAREFVQCDPQYMDLLIYNAYDNMRYNKKNNMDDLINEMFCETYNLKEEKPELYYKFNDIRDFDSYLKKIKCIDENGEPSIEKYNEYGQSLYELHVDYLANQYGRKK